MTDVETAALAESVGRSMEQTDTLSAERVNALVAVFGDDRPPLSEGQPLPALRHWLFFWTIVARGGLGRDGHPRTGDFIPAMGERRRMWAGSRLDFIRPLIIGTRAIRRSTITSAHLKQGRSGSLAFVTVRHEIGNEAGVAVTDEHDIVYRSPGPPTLTGQPASAAALHTRNVFTDPVQLFRYSALTFNGHRIHYDRTYAREVEGYPDLVVHGPLLATLMADLAVQAQPDARLRHFEFRGLKPVFVSRPFTVNAGPGEDGSLNLWIADADAILCMRAVARFD